MLRVFAGMGGPYCQGTQRSVRLASSFTSGPGLLVPGVWQYFNVYVQPTISWQNALTFSWTLGQAGQAQGDLLLVISPMYLNSMGDLYFMPPTSLVYNNTNFITVGLLPRTSALCRLACSQASLRAS